MAKYDHGGGCACGLQAECNCASGLQADGRRTASYRPPKKDTAAEVVAAARALLDDIRRRHPGEDFYCPVIIALDDAVKAHDASAS